MTRQRALSRTDRRRGKAWSLDGPQAGWMHVNDPNLTWVIFSIRFANDVQLNIHCDRKQDRIVEIEVFDQVDGRRWRRKFEAITVEPMRKKRGRR